MFKKVDISIDFLGIHLDSPFILSAAPPTDELEMAERGLEAGWAGVILKTTSVEGNPVELKNPMMSSFGPMSKKVVGLGNIDLISHHHIDVVEERVRYLKKKFPNKMIAASIMGASKEDWQTLVWRLKKAGADLIECSFSCPQGSMGEEPGKMLAQSVEATEKVTRWVKEAADTTPVLIKITPQVTDIVEVAKAVKRGGADGITASNTIPSLTGVDIYTFEPYPTLFGEGAYSGLSGPAIKPITLRTIAEIAKNVDIVISGNGGAFNWRDAVEFMAVGASNVQFCTLPMHYGFRTIRDLRSGLEHYLKEMGFTSPMEIVGKALKNIKNQEDLVKPETKSEINYDKCIGCGLCFAACNDGGHMAISWDSELRKPTVNEDKCTGCAMCMQVCPVDAIRMREKFDSKVHYFAERR
ncbi:MULTISPECIES: NAD-dependent dihydropyrimidine dehydrogenase subunit PreA [Caldisericum]|jgi:dihydropyrimidine dehydrogenase (NAD+) subunit PreA|uniref:NAD-dependent dihydropyrimidine dehydrogenase subunit PreA n=1 Tax=Caldisericum TaxID=693074 RepID=UPI00175F2B43|nr:NAD-dependent dihydropyrimidine dehydrogenase subunit PreA [Thermodesulfobium narugense]